MNPGWRIIDCTKLEGALRYSRGNLIVTNDDSDTAIPLSQIAIVLVGVNASVSGAVLIKLSEYDIALLVCDWRGIPVSACYPAGDHSRIGARHQSQSALSKPRAKQAWAGIIRAKIVGQANVLSTMEFDDAAKELFLISKDVKSGDTTNVEAQAARRYWRTLSESSSFVRTPGISDDLTNSALNYGYTILRGIGIRAVSSAGLAGALGIFHHGRGNSFALVDDLMEPFRPLIDFLVFSRLGNLIETDNELGREQKKVLAACADEPFVESGKTLNTVFVEFAQSFGNYVEGKNQKLVVPTWEGPFDAGEGE